jgi:hypothetical protein
MACLTNPVNTVWTFLPSGSPLSAMSLPTQIDLYDVKNPSGVSIRFQSRVFRFYSIDGASGRHKMVSINSPFNPMHLFSWIWFLG